MLYKFILTTALLLRLERRRAGPARLAGGPMSPDGFGTTVRPAPDSGPGSGSLACEGEGGDWAGSVEAGAAVGVDRCGRMKRRLRHMTAPPPILTR